MATLILRPIRPEDNEAIAAIIRRSLEEFNANKPGTVYFDTATDHLSDVFATKRSAYFILEEDGIIAGGGGFYPTEGLPGDTCELVKMYLAAPFRGKGYGKMLLEHCIREAKADGYTKMYIETMPELQSAIILYRRMGFVLLEGPCGSSGHTGCDIWMMKGPL